MKKLSTLSILLIILLASCSAPVPQGLLANASITSLIASASAGDTVIIPAGDYSSEGKINVNKSITLQCAVKRTCITKGIRTSTNNVTIDGFVLAFADGAAAARLEGNNITFINNEIHDTVKGTSSDADGINWYGSGDVIYGNYIHNIDVNSPTNSAAHVDCFQTWLDGADNALIENNICDNFYANSNEGTQCLNAEAQSGTLTGVIFRNNYCRSYGKKLDIESGVKGMIVDRNIFVGGPVIPNVVQQYGIFTSSSTNTTATNNIFWDMHNTNGTSLLLGVVNSSGNMLNTDPKLSGYCSLAFPNIGVSCGSVITPIPSQMPQITFTPSFTHIPQNTNTPTIEISRTASPTDISTIRTPTKTTTITPSATKTVTPTPTLTCILYPTYEVCSRPR